MGYYTQFSGEFTLSRPLSWAEIGNVAESVNFTLRRASEKQHTPEGILEVVTANAIVPRDGDETKAYGAETELREMVACLPNDVTVVGEIRGDGDDAGDVRRYVIQDGRPRELKARLVWEDGYSEPGRR